jgi:hypothetical protein
MCNRGRGRTSSRSTPFLQACEAEFTGLHGLGVQFIDAAPYVKHFSGNYASCATSTTCHFATAVWPETCRGSEPCERRVARDRRETASAGPSPAQVTDLRLLQPAPGAAVSRAVERFAERHVPANIRDMTK